MAKISKASKEIVQDLKRKEKVYDPDITVESIIELGLKLKKERPVKNSGQIEIDESICQELIRTK